MSQAVQNFLNSFNRLNESEQWEITSEILKRTLNFDFPSLTDEELIQNAEELFLELDWQELKDEKSEAR
jgi:hypothetical protein